MVSAGVVRTGFQRETDYEKAPLTPPFPHRLAAKAA